MTARAPGRARPRVASTRFLLAIIGVAVSARASAEVGAQVSVYTDARFRGYSQSAGHPIGTLDLTYDDASGFYVAASGSVVASDKGGIKPFEAQLGGGYAHRVSDVTFDIGAIHSEYSHYGRWAAPRSYTEIYAGASYRFLSARVAFSPHYFEPGARTVYGEANATFSPGHKFDVAAHIGALIPIDYREPSGSKPAQYDWRLGVSRDIGHVTLHLIGSGGGPTHDFYNGRMHSRTALVAGISWSL